eukprot:jgi/Tetstr1/462411/TSEL_007417.t1
MAVPAPPMSRATSSQHPATTASATADGAVAGGGTPCQATMMRLMRRVRRRRRPWSRRLIGLRGLSRRARLRSRHPPNSHLPAGHADLLVAMLTGALRAVAESGHMHYHVRVLAGRPSCVYGGQRTEWECCCDGTPAWCGPKYPCMATHQRAVPCPTTAAVRAEFRHVRDALHDATRAAVCEASEKARAAGRVRRVRRRTAREMKESETCRQ